jgi:PPOX class probable F420-dependent enzyme
MQISSSQLVFITRQPVGRLATADSNGQPHVVPVCFVYHNDAYYIAIDDKPKQTLNLKRLRNIAENPLVSLVIDVYSDDWSQLAWVMIQGKATTRERGDQHPDVLAALRQKYHQYQTMTLEDHPLIEIAVEHVISWGM